MFYAIADGHGLPHDPFTAIVSPRPVAWISSRDAEGRANLAPYSFFTAVAYVLPQIVISSIGNKPDHGRHQKHRPGNPPAATYAGGLRDPD